MNTKRSFLWILGIVVVTAAVIMLGWDEIKGLLLQANLYVLAFLCLLQIGTLALSAFNWHFLMGKLAPGHAFARVFAVYLGGNFVESVTPASKLGGEAARVYLFRRLTSLSYTKIAGIMLAHKYVSLLPFVFLCTVVLLLSLFSFELPPFFLPAFFTLLGLFAVVVLLMQGRLLPQPSQDGITGEAPPHKTGSFRKKWQQVATFLEKASAEARTLATTREQLLLLVISFVVWALYPVKVYLVAGMLGLKVDFVLVVIATYCAYMVSMIPLLPGGLGTFEGSMALIFALSGLSPAAGLAVALLSRLVTYWFSLLLSAVAAAVLALETNPLPGAACGPDSLRGPP